MPFLGCFLSNQRQANSKRANWIGYVAVWLVDQGIICWLFGQVIFLLLLLHFNVVLILHDEGFLCFIVAGDVITIDSLGIILLRLL